MTLLAAAVVAVAATFGELKVCADAERTGETVYRVTLARHGGATRFRGDTVTIPSKLSQAKLVQTAATIFPDASEKVPGFTMGLILLAPAAPPAAGEITAVLTVDGRQLASGPASYEGGRYLARLGDPTLEEMIEANQDAPYSKARSLYGKNAKEDQARVAALNAGSEAEARFLVGGKTVLTASFPLSDQHAALKKSGELGKRVKKSCR